jgi:hypothetical protein
LVLSFKGPALSKLTFSVADKKISFWGLVKSIKSGFKGNVSRDRDEPKQYKWIEPN